MQTDCPKMLFRNINCIYVYKTCEMNMENQKHKKETDYCERSRKDELFWVSLIKERKVYQPLLRI